MWDDAPRDDEVPQDDAWGVRRAASGGPDPARLLGEPTVLLLSRLPLVDRLLLEDRLAWLVEQPAEQVAEQVEPESRAERTPAPPLPGSVRDPAQLVELVGRLPPELRQDVVDACLEVLARPRPRRAAAAGRRLIAVLPAILGTAGIVSVMSPPTPRVMATLLTTVPLVAAGVPVVTAVGRRSSRPPGDDRDEPPDDRPAG